MSILVVPDVHEQIPQLERLLKHAGAHEQTVFLGDWFDSFERTPKTTQDTLDWLLANVERPDYTFLWGNHDLPYAYPFGLLMCSGHDWHTRALLANHQQIWKRFILSLELNGWRLSHAGFHHGNWSKDIDDRCELTLDSLKRGEVGRLLRAGWQRGGGQDVGGCTWLDWKREFKPVPGVKQIVGHSRDTYPREIGDNHCIDTDLQYYAVIGEDGKVSIHKVS